MRITCWPSLGRQKDPPALPLFFTLSRRARILAMSNAIFILLFVIVPIGYSQGDECFTLLICCFKIINIEDVEFSPQHIRYHDHNQLKILRKTRLILLNFLALLDL